MTLSRRITLMVLAVIAVTSLVVATLSAFAGRQSSIAQVDERLIALRNTIVIDNDPVKALLASLISAPTDMVASLIVPDEQPIDLLDGNATGQNKIGSISTKQLLTATRAPVTTKHAEPIRIIAIDLGVEQWLVIGHPISDIHNAFRRQLFLNYAIAIVVALLGSAVASSVTRRSLEPLRKIVDYSSSVASGTLNIALPADASAKEVRELQSSITSMVDALRDAADSKSRSETAMREFLADVAHELRTPLTTVRAYAEILASERPAEPEVRERAMGRIADESRRMSKLIDDLLLLARLSSAPTSLRENVDLAEIAASHFRDLSAIDPDRVVSIECSKCLVVADEDLVNRMFANIASNVHRHTPPTAAVHIRCSVLGPEVVCSIDDAGPGLDIARLEALSRGTQRFDPLRSKDARGSGLGLHLVSSIARSLGGSASFERSSLGGLKVVVRLPAQLADSR